MTPKIQNCELQHPNTSSSEGVGANNGINALEYCAHRNGGAIVLLLSAPLLLLLSHLPAHLSQPPLHIIVPLENYLSAESSATLQNTTKVAL